MKRVSYWLHRVRFAIRSRDSKSSEGAAQALRDHVRQVDQYQGWDDEGFRSVLLEMAQDLERTAKMEKLIDWRHWRRCLAARLEAAAAKLRGKEEPQANRGGSAGRGPDRFSHSDPTDRS